MSAILKMCHPNRLVVHVECSSNNTLTNISLLLFFLPRLFYLQCKSYAVTNKNFSEQWCFAPEEDCPNPAGTCHSCVRWDTYFKPGVTPPAPPAPPAPPQQLPYSLSETLTSHMVLQQQPAKAQLWGWGTPGTKLRVNGGTVGAATVAANGKWSVEIAPQKAGAAFGTGQLTFTTDDGQNKRVLEDVLFGEVWLCTGQSNMAVGLSSIGAGPAGTLPLKSWSGDVSNGAAEIANASAYPLLRLAVQQRVSLPDGPTEHANLGSGWFVPAPHTVGSFSAVCWMFGRRLQERLGVPVGLVENCVGGTAVERWSSTAALSKCDQTREGKLAQCKSKSKSGAAAEDLTTSPFYDHVVPSAAAPSSTPPADGAVVGMPGSQGTNSTLYNGMMAPWIPTALQGVSVTS